MPSLFFKSKKSCLNLFIFLYILVFSLYIIVLNFPAAPGFQTNPFLRAFSGNIDTGGRKIKIGLVNLGGEDNHIERFYHNTKSVETVTVEFEAVDGNKKWEDFFPEWIDEEAKWAPPKCPEIPLPAREKYRGLDVVVARVPCGGGGLAEGGRKGVRDVFRLQVNLVVANLAVEDGLVGSAAGDRTVFVVFVGPCGPMPEIFRCDDLLTRVGDYWVYKPDLRKLKQKVLMPVGTCQIASPFAEIGDESWSKAHYRRRLAFATVLHSSEAYVCGAIALAQSIIQSNSSHDLVLLHDSSISPKSLKGLRSAGWITRQISPIRNPNARKNSYNEWNYSKLRLWQLKDYDKIIFIDSDIVVLQNLDRFFYYPQLSAAGNDGVLFNSGIMVVEPSECVFDNLMAKVPKLKSYNGGDQGFLNEAFVWWHRLPAKLNYLKVFQRSGNRDHEIPRDVYAIHLLGLKPWMCYRDYDCNWDMADRHRFASDSAHWKWWKVFDKMPKRLQKYCGLTKQMDARIRKWRGIAKKANLSDGHWRISVRDPRQRNLIQ